MPSESNELSSRPIHISDQEIPYNALQAIFYKITEKVDRIRNKYRNYSSNKRYSLNNFHGY